MKVRYNPDGTITAVTVDSQPSIGTTMTVPDSQDLIRYPSKYAVVDGVLVVRPSLALSVSPASVKADNVATITISMQAKKADGTNDTSASHVVNIRAMSVPYPMLSSSMTLSSPSVTLAGGVGSLTVKSSAPVSGMIMAQSATAYGGSPALVQFTA